MSQRVKEITEKIEERYGELDDKTKKEIFNFKNKGFTDSVMLEAARRTVAKFGELNINYMFKILHNWSIERILTMQKVRENDTQFIERKKEEKIKNNKSDNENSNTKDNTKDKPLKSEKVVFFDKVNNEVVDAEKIALEWWGNNIGDHARVEIAMKQNGEFILISSKGDIIACPPDRFIIKKD